ncbi:SDR family NAD(P)-dependent oxidoreductase [Microbacterium sp.]|uniref:SDR family NAD(P)-dependent oxidoreductase n=1 Tax=Microbacterium sp. TaxID=51671 RepID=UPI003A8B163C
MEDFEDRVAFITGGASGAGFGQARVFGAAGCRIAIADVRQDALDDAVATLATQGIDAFPVTLDIRDRDAYARAADAVEDHFDAPVTLLFNTAGVNGFGALEEATYADFDWILGVNFGGVVNGMQTFVPRMIAAGRGGHIVSVASMAGFEGNPTAGIYAASKAAVMNLMESYAIALAPHGIGVSTLCPASVRSDIANALDRRPDELASGSSFRDDPRFIDAQRRLYAGGMDPIELAGHVRTAIEENLLYVLPFTETREGVRAHFDRVLSFYDAYDTDPAAADGRARAFLRYREEAQALRESP